MVGQPGLQLPQNQEQVVGRLVKAPHGVIDLPAQVFAAGQQGIVALQQPEAELLGQHRVLGHEAGQELVFLARGQFQQGTAQVGRQSGHENLGAAESAGK